MITIEQIGSFTIPNKPVARAALIKGMDRAVKRAIKQARLNASGRPGPNVDKGMLRASITGEVRDSGADIVGVVGAGNNLKYAAIQELGGTIKPKDPNGYLTFKIDGHFVSVKSVTLPARPYLKPAVDSPFMRGVIDHELRAAINGVTGAT